MGASKGGSAAMPQVSVGVLGYTLAVYSEDKGVVI
jgi:hypothetical protein